MRELFNRWFFAGAFFCFLSFIRDVIDPTSSVRDDIRDIRGYIFNEMMTDPRIVDALNREPKRFMHDRKNFVIEVFRYLLKTHELKHEGGWVASFIVKAIWFAIIAPWFIIAGLLVLLVWAALV